MLELPVSQPTCVAFGGKNLDLLFVTSAHQGLQDGARENEPQAGDLFIFNTNYQGLIENPFKPVPGKYPTQCE